MATVMAPPRPQSILLNPSPAASPRHYPLSLPCSPSHLPKPLSSSSSSSSDDEQNHQQKQYRSSSVPGNAKRIRFAPLPVPDPNSDSVFLEAESINSQEPSPLSASESQDSLAFNLISIPCKDDECLTPTALDSAPLTRAHQSVSLPPSPTGTHSKRASFSQRLLKPLFAPWIKSSPGEDSLYRVSSRESTQSARGRPKSSTLEEFGSPLSRWESSSSISSYVSDSGRSLSRRPKSSPGSIGPFGSRPSTVNKTPSAKPGMRMLNGRVYGRKRPYAQSSTNPFANVQSQEPEFVEWGYGGMGSNKVNEHSGVGGRWKNVQGDGNTSAFGGARSGGGDEDDSSGMAWVKKRKEERERAKREQEESAKKNSVPEEKSTPEEELKEEERTPKLHLDILPPTSPRPTVTPHDSDYICKAVPMPAHKHQPHTHKRDVSGYRVHSPIIQTPSSENPPKGIIDMSSLITNDEVIGAVDKQLEHVVDDSNGSTSDEDSSVTDEDDDEDSESDSESEDEEATRRTAVGAGVEKISRHKDHLEAKDSDATSTTTIPTVSTPGIEV